MDCKNCLLRAIPDHTGYRDDTNVYLNVSCLSPFGQIAIKVFYATIITIIMSVKNNLRLIEEILANLEAQSNDKHLQTLHDLGYLMGLLAKLANNDSFVYSALKAELERLKNKK